MELEYKDYTSKEKKLLAIIGEAYLGMTEGASEDYSYYKSRLNQAIEELEDLQEKLAKAKEIIIYRAYKDPISEDFKWRDFRNKSQALAFVKNNNWDVLTEVIYEDDYSYDRDDGKQTDIYIRPGFNYGE